MEKRKKRVIIFSILITFIISLIITLNFISPEKLVDKIGVNNSYLFGFLVSFLGGFSTFTSFSMVAVLITLVLGGVNPIYLGVISGVGLAIGDIIMFITSSKGRELIKGKYGKKLEKLSRKFNGKSRKLIPFITYIYIGLTPLPNDLLIVFLAMIKYPIKKLYPSIILGDITYPLIITILTAKGISII